MPHPAGFAGLCFLLLRLRTAIAKRYVGKFQEPCAAWISHMAMVPCAFPVPVFQAEIRGHPQIFGNIRPGPLLFRHGQQLYSKAAQITRFLLNSLDTSALKRQGPAPAGYSRLYFAQSVSLPAPVLVRLRRNRNGPQRAAGSVHDFQRRGDHHGSHRRKLV